MKIEPLQQNDLVQVSTLRPEGWQDILPAFEFYTSSSFCSPLKVMIDDSIAGVGSTILHNEVAWLGHIIVHRDFRRRGIGLLITKALIESVRATSCETIYLLATDMGAPVYEKAGFKTETEYLFFKDVVIENPAIGRQVLLYENSDKEELVSLDQAVSGENRFFHLEKYLPGGYVYREYNQLKGFYMPGFGDGLVIANEPAAGLALLQKHLAGYSKLVFPKDNLIATRFLYEKGYKETSTGKRMRLGRKRNVNFRDIYNRIGGNLG